MKIGTKVRVSMGLDRDRTAVVIDMRKVKMDGQGVPMLDKGHYNPLRKSDVAIQYDDDGSLDVYDRGNLITLR